MKRLVPMIFSTSLRLPLKICGLFDIGFAGDTIDVASLGYDAPTDLISSSCLLEGIKSVDITNFNDALADRKLSNNQSHLINTSDVLDQLDDIEIDHFANESLDAFINLDQLLNIYFDETAGIAPINTTETFEMTLSCLGSDSFHTQSSVEHEQHFCRTTVDHVRFEPSIYQVCPQENMTYVSPLNQDYPKMYPSIFTIAEDSQQYGETLDNKRSVIEPMLSSSESSTCSESLDSVNIEESISNKQTVTQKKNKSAPNKRRRPTHYDLDEEALRLTAANEKLRQKIIRLEKVTQEMKAQLIATITGNLT